MKNLYTDLEKFLKGFNEAADVVSATLGPEGRNVYISETYTSRISNDGARIAYNIFFSDPEKNAGANVVKNAAAKTNDDVGDGTTTTVVLLQAIVKEALQRKESPTVVRESLKKAVEKAVKLLKESSEPFKQSQVEEVALVSAEYPDLARMIAEITKKLGVNALIAVGDSPTAESSYEIVDGYEINSGFVAPVFMTDTKTQQAIYEDIPIFISGKKITKVQDIKKITDALEQKGIDQCAFFVSDIDDVVTAVLAQSKLTGRFKSVVVRITKDILPDLASVTGAKPFGDEFGKPFNSATIQDLGIARKIVVDARTSMIMGDPKGATARALELEIDATGEDNDILKARLQERAARLRGKIAVLKIGANSDFAREHKKDKAQDVVKAIPAAAAEGLVNGAGETWCAVSLELGETIGEEILKKALVVPYQKILEGSGDKNGFKLMGKGIKDPAKVERVALENAAEAAGIVITLTALILEDAPKP